MSLVIIHRHTIPRQTRSTCERLNSTLAQTFKMYCNEKQTNSPQFLPSVIMAFRMSPATESTSLSQFYMVFDKEMLTLLWFQTTMASDAKAHFDNLLERLIRAKEIALSNVKKSQAKSKEHFDKTSKEQLFALHDRVMLRCFQSSNWTFSKTVWTVWRSILHHRAWSKLHLPKQALFWPQTSQITDECSPSHSLQRPTYNERISYLPGE